MTTRRYGVGVGRSPLELAGIAVALGVFIGVGVLWGSGVLVGSLLGSVLPGSTEQGIAAVARAFPDVGRAWAPPIPSGLVWAVAALVTGGLAPLVWKLFQVGRLTEQGAQWASTIDLQRTGLLVSDRPLAHAVPEEPSDAA